MRKVLKFVLNFNEMLMIYITIVLYMLKIE